MKLDDDSTIESPHFNTALNLNTHISRESYVYRGVACKKTGFFRLDINISLLNNNFNNRTY